MATATTTKAVDPKQVTVYGRLSFPVWTAQAAYDKSQGGKYPYPSVDKAKPDFSLTLEQDQLDKLLAKINDEFVPYIVARHDAGEKKDELSKAEVKQLIDPIKKQDWDNQPFNSPFKAVSEKTAALAPEAVVVLKVIGNEGQDMVLKARVNSEDELLVNDGSQLIFPCIKGIDETVHDLYPGAYVAVTLNLYAYRNGKHPGFSAGGTTPVFKADAERFGGGVAVDEDEIFAD